MSDNTNIIPTRTPADHQWLDTAVEAAIDAQIAAGNEFTAYTITKLLRTNNPALEIKHDDVQFIVHQMMPAKSAYEMQWKNWNGEMARTYGPKTIVQPPAPQTQVQSSNPVKQIAAKIGEMVKGFKL